MEEIGRWSGRQVPGLQGRLDRLMAVNQANSQAGQISLTAVCGMGQPMSPRPLGMADRAAYAVGGAINLHSHYLAGMWDGTKGIVQFAWRYGAIRQMVDPKGWATDVGRLAEGIGTGVQHPVEFAKQVIDVETWQKDPARAYGKLAPEALLSALTGGAGLAAQAAARGRFAARQVANVRSGARAAAAARGARAERLKSLGDLVKPCRGR